MQPGLQCAAIVFASLFLLTSRDAKAQAYRDGPPPKHRLVYRDLSLVRVNPLGLISDARLSYRFRLYEDSRVAFRDNFVSLGIAPTASAAFGRVGPIVEVQPATFLQVWALYEVIGYFGGFNFLQSFPSAATAVYSDTELRRRGGLPGGDPAKNYSARGTQLLLGATLQAKVGPIAAREILRVGRPDMDLRAGDRVFYDIYYDLLVGDRGWFYANDIDVLYQAFDSRLSAGLRWSTARALYSSEHFGPADNQSAHPGAIHRAGPLAAWTFKKKDGNRFEPTIIAVANWWLRSPYRAGQDVPHGVPYMLVALNITGDLL